MPNVINNIIGDKQNIKTQLGTIPDVNQVLKSFESSISVKEIVTKIVKITYDGSNDVFILNSPTYGILGQNRLGDSASSDELHAVLPRNNIFIEYFGQDEYINTTNSTGTINTTDETYTLSGNEILESEVIAKTRSPITSVKILSHEDLIDSGVGMGLGSLELGVTTFTDDNVLIEFSNDSGTTWFSGNENEIYTFPSSSVNDELKYRLSGDVIISSPIYIQVNP